MSACADYEIRLHALLDGELDAANSIECERHIAACDACQTALAQLQALRQSLRNPQVRFDAPTSLQVRIARTGDIERKQFTVRSRLEFRRLIWPTVSLALAATLAVMIFAPFNLRSTDNFADEAIASHVRSLQANHLVDVPTSDRHVVKPWFAGRVDFSPVVLDLADRGFELIGGRLDYLQNHPVAALAYRRRAHIVNLFIWPASNGEARTTATTHNGYNVIRWQQDGMTFCAVSDLNATELRDLQNDYMASISH